MSFNLGVAIGQSGTIADLDRKVATLRHAVAERDAEIVRLHQVIETQNLDIAILEAQNEGLLAQRDAYQEQHPDSPLLRDSGQRFKSGDRRGRAKSNARVLYERAFDARAKERGVADPTAHRDN